MFQYFVNVWNAVVAFSVNNGPMAILLVVAGIFIGVMIVLCISHLERMNRMKDAEEIGELAQSMWEEYEREHGLEVDTAIVGKDCPACGMFLEEGHQCPDEDEDERLEDALGSEAVQAMNAFRREQASEPTWEERERRADFERRAYCGWEDSV